MVGYYKDPGVHECLCLTWRWPVLLHLIFPFMVNQRAGAWACSLVAFIAPARKLVSCSSNRLRKRTLILVSKRIGYCVCILLAKYLLRRRRIIWFVKCTAWNKSWLILSMPNNSVKPGMKMCLYPMYWTHYARLKNHSGWYLRFQYGRHNTILLFLLTGTGFLYWTDRPEPVRLGLCRVLWSRILLKPAFLTVLMRLCLP